MRRLWTVVWVGAIIGCSVESARGDERRFGYVYEPEVLPKGAVEFEQWLTGKFGREGQDYARWDFREELEWGLTDKLTTALYLNFRDTFSSPHDEEAGEGTDEFEFKGVSSEWKYQLLSPYTHPVGVVAYFEATTDGAHENELEEKLIIGTDGEVWSSALNLILEQEWEREHGETEEESALEITAGLSRKIDSKWAVGLEALHTRGYEGTGLDEEVYTATFVGPNVHYAAAKWWATFTVMPQVYGDGEGADNNLQLTESHRVETRLVAGINF